MNLSGLCRGVFNKKIHSIKNEPFRLSGITASGGNCSSTYILATISPRSSFTVISAASEAAKANTNNNSFTVTRKLMPQHNLRYMARFNHISAITCPATNFAGIAISSIVIVISSSTCPLPSTAIVIGPPPIPSITAPEITPYPLNHLPNLPAARCHKS